MKIVVSKQIGNLFKINFEYDNTVADIKKKIEEKDGVKSEHQVLVHAGKILENSRLAVEYGIDDNSTIYLTLRLKGGKF